jgi:acyl-CoA thioesterase
MVSTLDAASAVQELERGRFLASLPDGWKQGPGVFGGLVLATFGRAMDQMVSAPEQSLRSLQMQLTRPVAVGDNEIEVQIVRYGKTVSHLRATLGQGGEVAAMAQAAWGQPRKTVLDELEPGPAFAPPESLAADPTGPKQQFAQHVEFRPAVGGFPFGAAERAETGGWLRLLQPGEISAQMAVLALLDCWWPANLVRMRTPGPMSSLTINVHLMTDCSTVDPAGFFAVLLSSLSTHHGYADQTSRLWDATGQLIGYAHQCVVLV